MLVSCIPLMNACYTLKSKGCGVYVKVTADNNYHWHFSKAELQPEALSQSSLAARARLKRGIFQDSSLAEHCDQYFVNSP